MTRRHRHHRTWAASLAAALGLALTLTTTTAFAQEDLERLADQLIELRGEVEALNDEIEARQQTHRRQISSVAQRRSELEARIARQELEAKELSADLAKIQAEASTVDEEVSLILPTVRDAVARLEAVVRASLPFQVEDRVAELSATSRRLETREVSAARAFNQLWTFIEDELRLSRETALVRQEIQLATGSELADVIRLGMVSLYYRTGDGRYGFAERSGDGWTYTQVGGADATRLAELFDNFDRSVRTGFFEMPSALPGGGR